MVYFMGNENGNFGRNIISDSIINIAFFFEQNVSSLNTRISIFSSSIRSLVMAATPKSVLYVALMGTILSVLISICCKRLFTTWTNIFIIGFAFNLIEVLIPPLVSATIRTKPLFLSASCLHNRDTTTKAKMPGCINR